MKNKNYPLYDAVDFRDFRVMVEQAANKAPDSVAFSFRVKPTSEEITEVTFEQTRLDARYIGTYIHSKKWEEKTVAIIGGASYGWCISYFAVMSSGAVTVPIDREMPAEEISDMVRKANCVSVFYAGDISAKIDFLRQSNPEITDYVAMSGDKGSDADLSLDEVIKAGKDLYASGDRSYYDYEIDPDKLSSVVFTSGTTGKGKGVMLSQTNIARDMILAMPNFFVTDRTMLVLPLHHTYASTVNLVGHYAQNVHIYISSGIKYFQKEMKEFRPKHLILVPLFVETLYKRIWSTAEKNGMTLKLKAMLKMSDRMRKVGIDLRKKLFSSITKNFGGELEFIICGGAALHQDIIDFFDSVGVTILNGYGITECSPLISCNRNKWQKRNSVGTPILEEEVKIIDPETGATLPVGAEGEICVRGVNVMLGYLNDPEATAEAFDSEGYFKTGDYGKLDEDGWLFITGRKKNLIIFSNGKNVYPEEIENEISSIYGVSENVVYAGESVSDPSKEIIVAEIYPDFEALEGHGITDVQSYFNKEIRKVNERMVSYKRVGKVKIRDTEFAKNTTKKIIRYVIDRTID